VTIQASDTIVGSINTSGSKAIVHEKYYPYYDRYGHRIGYSHSFDGGDVSVKTDTFKVGTISTDGGQKKGKVTIDAPPSVPISDSGNDTGSGSGQAGSGSNQTNTADGASSSSFNASGASSGGTISNSEPVGSNSLPTDDTNNSDDVPSDIGTLITTSSSSNNGFFNNNVSSDLDEDFSEFYIQDKQHFQEIRLRLLQFIEAQKLAGQRMTAQQIADQVDIPLDIAQIAVLNPIGKNIQVDVPDLAEVNQDGILIAGKPLDWKGPVLRTIQRLIPFVKGGAKNLKKFIFGFTKLPLYVKDIFKNPKAYWGKSAEEISQAFRDAGFKTTVRPSTMGSQRSTIIDVKGHPQIQQIEVHPGGGLHKGAYIKFSTSTNGRIKIVDPKTYKPGPNEKVTFIKINP
jgi:hypothetical protein